MRIFIYNYMFETLKHHQTYKNCVLVKIFFILMQLHPTYFPKHSNTLHTTIYDCSQKEPWKILRCTMLKRSSTSLQMKEKEKSSKDLFINRGKWNEKIKRNLFLFFCIIILLEMHQQFCIFCILFWLHNWQQGRKWKELMVCW